MAISQIYENLLYFLNLTFYSEAFWIVLPLLLSTLLMMIYFGIYREEKTEGDSHFSNSFVLIFVSIALLRYIYNLNSEGILNFVIHVEKNIATLFLLTVGYILVKFNFEHLLPKRINRYISSPLTMNLFAYTIILFVYSSNQFTIYSLISLILILAFLIFFLILIKIPSRRIADYLKREKEKESILNLKEKSFQVREMKEELKIKEKELRSMRFDEIEKKKKNADKLDKILKKKLRYIPKQ